MMATTATISNSTIPDATLLTPSQAIRSGSSNGENRRRNRPKGRQRGPNHSDQQHPARSNTAAENPTTAATSVIKEDNAADNANSKTQSHTSKTKKHKKKQKSSQQSNHNPAQPPPPVDTIPEKNGTSAVKKKPPNKGRKNSKKGKNKWWRSYIPEDAVDPITLDPLDSLDYPPFALVATEPFEPIDWPVLDHKKQQNHAKQDDKNKESDEEWQRRILEEQWGSQAAAKLATATKQPELQPTNIPIVDSKRDSKPPPNPSEQPKRAVNLFDGRALAYYMVSQLQFIDPLNRRDLNRSELVHLDRYLRRHGFTGNVTEAYDAKGITISSAGAASQTDEGRARILQEEARVLLNALFGNHHHHPPAPASNMLAQQYQQHERNHHRQNQAERRSQNRNETEAGIYIESGNFLVIDDDAFPGLRGNAPEFIPRSSPSFTSAQYLERSHNNTGIVQEHEFPPLAATATPAAEPPESEQTSKKTLPKAKTLSIISTLVKESDPEEQLRQWKAREEALRKAALSNLTFGSNPVALLAGSPAPGLPTHIITKNVTGPSEAQLQRNRALADALGVKPATERVNILSGWARPSEGKLELDEFGNELNVTLYPESLMNQARAMRFDWLLKLEKKWKTFLADDTTASLPLSKMDRPTRAFVHEYSDYWNLQTESFDPEPYRYINCVKLRDTRAPYPLLSEAIRMNQRPLLREKEQPSQQTAAPNASIVGRSMPPPPERKPLPLKPRSITDSSSTIAKNGISISGAPSRTMTDEIRSSRFSSLSEDRERPKLHLAKRTVPLELPPFEPQKGINIAEELERQRQRENARLLKEKKLEERRLHALEAAFASDDEDNNVHARDLDDDDSDWEEKEPVYQDSDDE
jgi:hypothetical protein